MAASEAIRLLGADLEIGSAHSGLVCPFCHGGTSREGSFRVHRVAEGLRYRCYRAKCGRSGLVYDALGGMSAAARNRQRKQTQQKMYTGDPVPLPPEHLEFYWRRFGLAPSALEFAQVMLDQREQRHVWPIHDSFMRVRGHNLRAASASWGEYAPIPAKEPKTVTFFNSEQPRCSWYRHARGIHSDTCRPDALLLVEDQISALKASEYVDSCALLGTDMHADVTAEIVRAGYARVVLALDQDATGKAYKLARRYASMLPLRVVQLSQDVKDMEPARIRELLYEPRTVRNHL